MKNQKPAVFRRYTGNSLLFLLLVSFLPLISGCEKFQKDPVIKIMSAQKLSDGSVLIKGKILEGHKHVTSAGFCYDTLTDPSPNGYASNSTTGNIDGDVFTATIPNSAFLHGFKRYYFRPWAKKSGNYFYGETEFMDSIRADVPVPPCSPALNYVNIGTGAENYIYVNSPGDDWFGIYFTAQSGNSSFTYEFPYRPKTGIYTTSTNPYNLNDVRISFYSGFISGVLAAGSPVYVNQLTPDSWEITVCNAPWQYNTSTLHMTSRMKCPM